MFDIKYLRGRVDRIEILEYFGYRRIKTRGLDDYPPGA